jgi:hypothetical protein
MCRAICSLSWATRGLTALLECCRPDRQKNKAIEGSRVLRYAMEYKPSSEPLAALSDLPVASGDAVETN